MKNELSMPNKLFIFGKPAKGDNFTDRIKETERLVSNFKYGINTFKTNSKRKENPYRKNCVKKYAKQLNSILPIYSN